MPWEGAMNSMLRRLIVFRFTLLRCFSLLRKPVIGVASAGLVRIPEGWLRPIGPRILQFGNELEAWLPMDRQRLVR